MEQKTKQYGKRSAILACLKGTKAHPSADTVYQMLQETRPDISLATVYRNLALFKQQGTIQSLGTVNGIERFDYNTAPHVHFICTQCQSVIDLPELTAPSALQAQVEAITGGTVSQCQLSFTGICQSCCCEKTGS